MIYDKGYDLNKIKDCIAELRKEIAEFMKDQGGYSNGYDTFIEDTTISHNTHQYLRWHTPISDKLTGEKKDELSYAVNEKLIKILNKYNIEDAFIRDDYQGEGCHRIKVGISFEREVDLWDYERMNKVK